jgi:hypothetical protein
VRGVERAKIYGSIYTFLGYAKWLENAMLSPPGNPAEPFDPNSVGLDDISNACADIPVGQ